jgi:hypothetical protein
LGVKQAGGRKPIKFGVKNTLVSGNISFQAPGIEGNRGAHEWWYTADLVNFTNPTRIPSTKNAKATAGGLLSGTRYAFFHMAIEGDVDNVTDGPVFLMVI